MHRDKDYESDMHLHISDALYTNPPNPKRTLAVLLSPSRSGTADLSADFKRVAERDFGLHTLCLAADAAHEQASVVNKKPPAKPVKVGGENKADGKKKKDKHNEDVEVWEAIVKTAWKTIGRGPDHDSVKAHGPWHAKFNDTMFWM
ncbi:hypothetical protein G6011_04242 [Alternaria panax]|uniref:Uncharacterized protein n=1 Tax=Alternaria panax TaxID=48097 RepID=A0AAD4IGN1_9PLEO|nr:hypothetical protein G6011_04242 [Alternaria panax]